MSFKKNKEKSNDALNTEINRIAINLSGRLGSLYDAYRDRVLEQLNIFRPEPTNHTLRLIRCNRIKGKHDSSKNILKIMSFEQELRLSILLNLSKNMEKPTIIDYFYPTNEYTRFIQYSSLNREENLPDIPSQTTILDTSSTLFNDATHIITKVHFGIDFTVVIQLPTITNIVVEIDHTLDKLCNYLQNHHNTDSLTIHDKSLLEKIVYTKVYSNIPHLRNLTTIYDVYCYLQENKNNSVDYPIFYTLKLIKEFYPQYNGEIVKVNLLSKELNDIIEDYVLQRTTDMKQLEKSIIEDMPKILCKHLKQRFACIETQWFDVKKIFTNEIERIANLVIRIRSGEAENLFTEQIFNDKEQMMIKNSIDELTQNVKHLEEKEYFIRCLNQQNFQYLNVIEYNIDQTDNENSIEHKLVQNDQHYRILCSNDCLNKNNSEELQKLICDLIEEAKNNSSLHLIYADFSDCSFPLSTMMVLSSLKKAHEDMIDQLSSELSTAMETFTVPFTEPDILTDQPTPTSVSIDETINIVLLGETGVGKSTFINAFANYLTFHTLEEAEAGQSVVLIPVSFMITVGDNFEEHIVKFGSVDESNNEDFDHPGHSVTQHCKSYIFNLNDSDQRKLCIIDTPGFGDTRGIEQDDLNMEHILEYVNNLTHINAICFLLKPNESKLHIYYRLCLNQLFSVLDQNNVKKVIVCFTNSRSTFYTPGDTAPLLKQMLRSLAIGDVPFKKENTFCFDSESFRYLVALQNGINFSELDRQEYEMSWIKSVHDSKRLIEYICKELASRCIQQE
ncbi:unnamed protein product [Rotaria sp. Silwood1]|nr:unnamed protein product [Rotaria sp. Silwood1]